MSLKAVSLVFVVTTSACTGSSPPSVAPTQASTTVTAKPTSTTIPTVAPVQSLAGLATMKQASDAVDRGNSALAVQYLKQAIGENPNLAEAHCSLGLIYLDQVANWPAAEQELRQGISIFERNKSTVFPGGDYKSSLSMCYAYLGYVVVEEAVIRLDIIHTRAVYEEAEGYYKKAVDLDPTNGKAQAGLKTVQATLEFVKQAPSKGR